jgi:hypothetical protein
MEESGHARPFQLASAGWISSGRLHRASSPVLTHRLDKITDFV